MMSLRLSSLRDGLRQSGMNHSGASNNITTTYSGNSTTVTDQAGKQRRSFTDALGRLIQVDEPNPTLATPAVTTYTYDTLDNLTQVVQSGSRQRSFTYNSLSQLLTAANPESGTIAYAYDADGNLLTKTDARGITTTFGYDSLHRLTGKTYSNGDPAVSYFYDQTSYNGLAIANGKGRRTGMSDAAGLEAWSYEIVAGVGWKTTDRRTTNGVTKDFVDQNNLAGSLGALTYPTTPNRTITYSYDDAGRALSAVDQANGINYALNATYTPHGALQSVLQGQTAGFNGITLTQAYNNRLQPVTIQASSTNGTVLDFTYCFNSTVSDFAQGCGVAPVVNNGNVGRLTNNLTPARSQRFTYDELNRIKTAQTQATTGQHCWGETFGYDIWANLLAIGGILPDYNGCTQESLSVVVTANNQISGNTYDAAGNMTSAPGMGSFTYDAENRMVATGGVSYTYDGDGKRVKKSNGKLYWYGMGSDALVETDLAGNNGTEFVFFNGKRIARRDSAGTVSYFFSDHLGSSRVVTNATGGIVEDSDFYPFGGERVITDTLPDQNYKFTGKERDSETGLDYFGARYYANALGRFTSTDPKGVTLRHLLNPQKLNKYSYVLNNPLSFVDPNGLEELTITVRAFIPQKNVAGFRGDDRSFSNQAKASSRVSISFKVETDPAKRGSANPMVDKPTTTVSPTQLKVRGVTVAEATSKGPNPPQATASYDTENKATVVVVTMDMANPLTPGAQGIRTDLQITIPQDASNVSVAGTVSGSPAFEINVTTENGKTTNIPIQDAASNAKDFVVGLEKTNTVNNEKALKEKENK